METIIAILSGFITLSFLLKISFYPSFRHIAGVAAACAGFVWIAWEQAAGQSRTQIADFLASPGRMQDAAVWITLESLLMIAFCFDTLSCRPPHDSRFRRVLSRLLQAYPGVLVGGVLGYALTQAIFAFPGTDFRIVAGGLAVLSGTGIALVAGLLRTYIDDRPLRLELLFTTNLFILLMGSIATENGGIGYPGVSPVDRKATAATLALLIAGAGLGYIWKRIHTTKS